jgi:hypothetical protein
MPKLTILAACEKFIIDRAELPSLINIFQNLDVQLANEAIPEHAITPLKWSVFTLWQHTLEELDVEFIQHLEVIAPNGKKFIASSTRFKVTSPRGLQTKIGYELQALPISNEGVFTVRVWLESTPDLISEYRFTLTHVPAKAEAQESVTA